MILMSATCGSQGNEDFVVGAMSDTTTVPILDKFSLSWVPTAESEKRLKFPAGN